MFYFEIQVAPSELPSCQERLNWPGRLAGNSEGGSRISKKKKNLDHLSPSFLAQKCWVQDLRFYRISASIAFIPTQADKKLILVFIRPNHAISI